MKCYATEIFKKLNKLNSSPSSLEKPHIDEPKECNHNESQLPLKPVCPVINTLFPLKNLFKLPMVHF